MPILNKVAPFLSVIVLLVLIDGLVASAVPSAAPSISFRPSSIPTSNPTCSPTSEPTLQPTSVAPTSKPSPISASPTKKRKSKKSNAKSSKGKKGKKSEKSKKGKKSKKSKKSYKCPKRTRKNPSPLLDTSENANIFSGGSDGTMSIVEQIQSASMQSPAKSTSSTINISYMNPIGAFVTMAIAGFVAL